MATPTEPRAGWLVPDCDLCGQPMGVEQGFVVCHPCKQAFAPSYFGIDLDDLWLGDCGCVHLLADGCPCDPEIRGFDVHHRCPHTDERVVVDGR